jgi:hypothetical protein
MKAAPSKEAFEILRALVALVIGQFLTSRRSP